MALQSSASLQGMKMTSGEQAAQLLPADAEVDVDDACEVDVADPNEEPKFRFNFRKFLRFMGPGWLMSLAYLDPGNLESDLQMGAYTGYTILWVLWWATVMGWVLQELSARIGVVTGRDLAQNVHDGYPKWLQIVIYINMEIAVIGSDIQEVVGSGIAINLLSNNTIPVWVGCIITGVDTFTFLAVHYLGIRYLEGLVCVLIAIMSFSFFVNWGETSTDSAALLKGWGLPMMKSYAFTQAIGAVGAVIMPHNLYLHSGLVLSRRINRASIHRVYEAIRYNAMESALALICSFFINLAIVAANANNFYVETCARADGGPFACLDSAAVDEGQGQGSCVLPSGAAGVCSELGLDKEGIALKHGLGDYALYIWAIGLLAAGQAATMTCTYAGQVIMGGIIEINLAPWKRVAFTRAIALGPSVAVAFLTIDGNLYNDINEYLNVLQSLQLPFAMLPVLHFSADRTLMGRFRPGPFKLVVNVTLALLILTVNSMLVVQFTETFSTTGIVFVYMYAVVYIAVCVRMVWTDIMSIASSVCGCFR